MILLSMIIAKHHVNRILINSENSADVLFYDAFNRMNLPLNQLKPISVPLVAFNIESVGVEGEITLPITAGTLPQQVQFMTFTVIRVPFAYNAILERPWMNQLDIIVSTKHLLVRFPTMPKINKMHGD